MADGPTTEIPADASEVVPDPDHALVEPGHLLFELLPVPVSDLERAKTFYAERLGFVLDVDVSPAPGVRFVQLTPPGSACSISLVAGGDQLPGTLRGLHLVVADIDAARDALIAKGVDVQPVVDHGGVKWAYFADPDGNEWCLQYMPWRVAKPA
jgi:catechol 2,3-dioxygenase-like lactoylglutathione lyase family enzyme